MTPTDIKTILSNAHPLQDTGPDWAEIIARLDLIVMRADALITKIMDHESEAVTRG